ncbi:hypothetical protein [Thalassomonas sp. RHCl1]|uniref:hypothetical protein n=1 Tax=Thalassomonas sp. RHCl1 TaxID=2995320 RepID=UPI00248D0F52|nr:hypothetical protein [Thalassomonas sp. RHCl1]
MRVIFGGTTFFPSLSSFSSKAPFLLFDKPSLAEIREAAVNKENFNYHLLIIIPRLQLFSGSESKPKK